MPVARPVEYSTTAANPHRKSVQEIAAESHAISRKLGEIREAAARERAARFPSAQIRSSRSAVRSSCSIKDIPSTQHTHTDTLPLTSNNQIDLNALIPKRGRKPKSGARLWRHLSDRERAILYARVIASRFPKGAELPAVTLQIAEDITDHCPNPADLIRRRLAYHLRKHLSRTVLVWGVLEVSPERGNLHFHGHFDITPDEQEAAARALRAVGGAWARTKQAIARQVDFKWSSQHEGWGFYSSKNVGETRAALAHLKPSIRRTAVLFASAEVRYEARALYQREISENIFPAVSDAPKSAITEHPAPSQSAHNEPEKDKSALNYQHANELIPALDNAKLSIHRPVIPAEGNRDVSTRAHSRRICEPPLRRNRHLRSRRCRPDCCPDGRTPDHWPVCDPPGYLAGRDSFFRSPVRFTF